MAFDAYDHRRPHSEQLLVDWVRKAWVLNYLKERSESAFDANAIQEAIVNAEYAAPSISDIHYTLEQLADEGKIKRLYSDLYQYKSEELTRAKLSEYARVLRFAGPVVAQALYENGNITYDEKENFSLATNMIVSQWYAEHGVEH